MSELERYISEQLQAEYDRRMQQAVDKWLGDLANCRPRGIVATAEGELQLAPRADV